MHAYRQYKLAFALRVKTKQPRAIMAHDQDGYYDHRDHVLGLSCDGKEDNNY